MPRVAKELSPIEVKRLKHPGDVSYPVIRPVGGVAGLALQLTKRGGRSWVLRTTVRGTRHDVGLGPFPEVSLAQAREAAREFKAKAREGGDPIAERRALRAKRMTFAEAVDQYLSVKLDELKGEGNRTRVHNMIMKYAVPVIGKRPVDSLQVEDILRVLEPIWKTKTATASRLRGRMENVLDWATVAGHRAGDNPARWKGNLKELLAAPNKISKPENSPAVPPGQVPAWFAQLSASNQYAAPALKFMALTAARTGEVLGATWDEIDGDLWVIPGQRMKTGKEHRVPLSTQAQALLKDLPRLHDNPLVFPAPRGGRMKDTMTGALMKQLHKPEYCDRETGKPAVPHGLRSTFRQWCAEADYPRELAEAALAHQTGSEVERAYQRSDVLDRRRALMQAWADYAHG